MIFEEKTFYHIPMRIGTGYNNICIVLCKIGLRNEAIELYRYIGKNKKQ